MPTKSVTMVKLDNFPVFSTKTQKNQLLHKKCQNSPWTNFHYLGQKKLMCSLKSDQIVSNEHRRRKKRKNIFFDVKARTTVPWAIVGPLSLCILKTSNEKSLHLYLKRLLKIALVEIKS
jgi:hypothetical protein